MAQYRLTPDADQDPTGVWQYTCEAWDPDQADRYLEKLECCCERIGAGRAVCRSFSEIDARLKSHHCGDIRLQGSRLPGPVGAPLDRSD